MKNRIKVLVTGAAGSVGLEVVRELAGRDETYDISVIDRNIRRVKKKLRPYLKHIRFFAGEITNPQLIYRACRDQQAVIHLAAIIPPLADEQPQIAERVNVEGTRLLVKTLEKINPGVFFLYASSISIYGDRVSDPWITVSDPLQPSEGDEYAKTKIRAEQIIRSSKLIWSIFRLTAIMGSQTRLNPLFFHMPLDTSMEIATARDTGYAFAEAISHTEKLQGKIFNLSGGPSCRTTYYEFLKRVFPIVGLQNPDFPHGAFAEKNFHCGYYRDSDRLNSILGFQHESLEDYYRMLQHKQNFFVRTMTRLFHSPIKRSLLKRSDPFKALRQEILPMINRFFYRKA
ncbi:MAG: NAD(P)-dependent oxidoreductase [Bacteroidales bacterium]|nr:NAD(P)-dependent oxidoreductase [Bacteroidales bacterium]